MLLASPRRDMLTSAAYELLPGLLEAGCRGMRVPCKDGHPHASPACRYPKLLPPRGGVSPKVGGLLDCFDQ